MRELKKYLDVGARKSVLRNKHMNNYREKVTERFKEPPSVVFAKSFTEKYLGEYVRFFARKYQGGDRLMSVIEGMIEAAKHLRTLHRPQAPLDYTARDALLVDFINHFGVSRGMDVGLYTKDIESTPDPYWVDLLIPELHGTAEEFVMRKIELWTEGRTPLNPTTVSEYVATVDIAPFPDAGMPTVVIWGTRFFHLASGNAQSTNDGSPWKYQECFCTASLTPSPGLPREAFRHV